MSKVDNQSMSNSITSQGRIKRSVTDLTHGDPLKATLMFAIPIFLSNIFQQLYNLTDISIIGHALGEDALSAIGSVSTIYGLFNSLLFGMGSGFSVSIARHFGSGDLNRLRKAVANTLFISIIWGIVITLAGSLSLKPLMRLLNTPDSIFDMAYGYAGILIKLLIFSFAYNVLSGMLRAIGNSKAPFIILVFTVITNIGLDLLLVYGLGAGLPGAAIATAVSQALSAVICFIYIVRSVPELHISRSDLVPDKDMLFDLFSAGISFALMYTVVNFGTLILQGAINRFGETTIAAHTTARKVSELCMMTVGTLANAMATFTGQNHGAHRYDRIRTGLKKVLMLSFSMDMVLILLIYTIGPVLVKTVSGSANPELIGTSMFYLKFDLPFYFVLSILMITRSTLQGMGAKIVPIAASLMEMALKFVTAKWLAVKLGYFGITLCEPLIWSICAVYILIVFFMSLKKLASNVDNKEGSFSAQ